MFIYTLLKAIPQTLVLDAIRKLSLRGQSLLSWLHSLLTTLVLLAETLASQYIKENLS